MLRPAGVLVDALIVVGCIASQLLAHFALAGDGAGTPRTMLLWAPLALVACWALVHSGRRLRWSIVLLGAGAVIYALGFPDDAGLSVIYGAPHAAAYLFLLWLFGRTLAPGREPLITRVARAVHGELAPRIESYTRNVTIAWCLFFGGQVAASAALYALAPLEAWSLFVNVLNLPLLVLMFAAEYLYRVARYRDDSHASIAGTLRAFARLASASTGAKAR